jgi:hypothetical protein
MRLMMSGGVLAENGATKRTVPDGNAVCAAAFRLEAASKAKAAIDIELVRQNARCVMESPPSDDENFDSNSQPAGTPTFERDRRFCQKNRRAFRIVKRYIPHCGTGRRRQWRVQN